MSDHSVEEVNQHIKKYLKVFVALLVFTGLTVWAYTWDISSVAVTLTIGLAIALIKGSLVGGYFMHLFGEKKFILYTLLLTVFLFFVLLLLPVISFMESRG